MERFFIAALGLVHGMGRMQLRHLLAAFPSAEYIWQASEPELAAAKMLRPAVLRAFLSFRQQQAAMPAHLQEECSRQGIRICQQGDADYPPQLAEIYDPPLQFFYRGTLLPAERYLAMVGARRASAYGRSAAEAIGTGLACSGITVVSGAARGIDTASHCGALQHGRTIAVLGCGVDVAYPRENRKLLDEIAENGAVLSEYVPGTQPIAAFFPVRNRIISGLSRGTIVVEAAERSGSLITAEFALSEGRDVFAVPGSIYSQMSRGCHRLIQQGAKLVTCVEDILDEYGWNMAVPAAQPDAGPAAALSKDEAAVYSILSWDHPMNVDEIIIKLHGNVANIAFLLLQMQLKGLIKEDSAHCYVRAVKEGVL
jgi:DNA processing protein